MPNPPPISGKVAADLARISYRQLPDRIRRRVAEPTDGEACWLWTGASGAGGYGLLTFEQRPERAHIVAYTAVHGPVPEGLELDHLCEVKLCVNPAHLEPVTHAENTRRHYARRATCSAGHPWNAANTYHRPSTGRRECRACNRDRQATRRSAP